MQTAACKFGLRLLQLYIPGGYGGDKFAKFAVMNVGGRAVELPDGNYKNRFPFANRQPHFGNGGGKRQMATCIGGILHRRFGGGGFDGNTGCIKMVFARYCLLCQCGKNKNARHIAGSITKARRSQRSNRRTNVQRRIETIKCQTRKRRK